MWFQQATHGYIIVPIHLQRGPGKSISTTHMKWFEDTLYTNQAMARWSVYNIS